MAVQPKPRPSYRPYIFMFILNLAIVAGIIYLLRREVLRAVIVTSPSPRPAVNSVVPQVTSITVLISGAVNQPGTFQLDSTARLADVLQRAGGVRSDADLSRFDLTRPLKPGDKITIPARTSNPPAVNNLVSPTSASTGALLAPQKLNLNTATLEQLETLPGIGPALAQRILDFRAANGAFETVEELKEVRGIGDIIFQQLESRVTVE